MKKSLAVMAMLAAAAGVAVAQPDRKLELVNLEGAQVESLHMRYGIDATWVLGDRNFLLRDQRRNFWLVTVRNSCPWMEKSLTWNVVPALAGRVRAGRFYEVRDAAHDRCDIGKVQQVASREAAEEIVGVKVD